MLSESPDDTFLLFALALEYVSLENDTEAAKYFEKVISFDKNYDAVYLHYGKLYERANDDETAIKFYKEGMNITQGKNQKNYNELKAALAELED